MPAFYKRGDVVQARQRNTKKQLNSCSLGQLPNVLPPERRAAAFRMNNNGWSEQLHNIEGHVTK